jgi:ATP-dependent helicase/nuclease subunit B
LPQPHHRRILFGPFQPDLEDGLLAAVEEVRAREPVASILLLVGSNLIGLSLSRMLARRLGGVAGVRVMTFLDLARAAASASVARAGLRVVTPAAETLLARRLAASLPEEAFFKRIAATAGFEDALLATFTDLEEGGLAGSDLRASFSARNRKIRELADLHERYARDLRERRLMTRSGLLHLAAADLEAAVAARRRDPGAPIPGLHGEPAAFFVYGLYDFTPLQERLVVALSSLLPATVFFPWRDGPAFEFARDARDRLLAIGFVPSRPPPAPSPAPRAIDRIRARLFAAPPGGGPTGDDDGNDASVRIIAAPGEPREALEIARTVAGLAREGLSFEEIAVVYRGGDDYPPLLLETLSRLGVPTFAPRGGSIRSSRAARAASLLLEIRAGDFERGKVIEFLTLADPPAGSGDPGAEGGDQEASHAADWDLLSRLAGIVSGREPWIGRLDRLVSRLERRATAREADPGGPADARLVDEARRFSRLFARFARALDAIPSEGPWSDLAGAVSRILRDFLRPSPGREMVLEIVSGLGALGAIEERTTLADLRRLLEDELARVSDSGGSFERGHLFLGDALAVRGLPFRAVIVAGMAEQAFPVPARQDPILLDEERERFNESIPGRRCRLPLKHLRVLEERLLFALACDSAGQRLVLTYPRIDPATARERLPSPFLLRVVEAITGRPCDYAGLQEFPWLTRIRVAELFPQDSRPPVLDREFDLRAVAEGIGRSDPALALLPAGVPGAAPFLLRGLRFERRRSLLSFTEVDGRLTSPEALAILRRSHALGEQPLSATRLEEYLTCPYKYFCERVLGLQPLDDPEAIDQLSPLERGTLLHEVLQEFLVRLRQAADRPLRPSDRDRATRDLLAIFDRRFERLEARGLAGPALSRRIQRRALRADLRRWLDLEIEEAERQGGDGLRPRHFEVRFGMEPSLGKTDPGLPDDPLSSRQPVRLADREGGDLLLKGRIDRIDLSADRRRARVIDYKSGRLDRYRDDDLGSGTSLQLPVYILAAESLLPDVHIEGALYRSVSRRGRFKDVGFRRQAWDVVLDRLREAARLVIRGVADGVFFHNPDESAQCLRCDSRPVCGGGREARFERKKGDPAAAPFRAFKEAGRDV